MRSNLELQIEMLENKIARLEAQREFYKTILGERNGSRENR
jgi:hypothetical protein